MNGIDKSSLINGRKDLQLADALTKVSPEAQKKTRAKAEEFEAMFLNSMFSQMTTGVSVSEDGKKFAVVKDGVSLQQLVDGLNGLGIGPRDLISILQAIKAAGAIEADIELM